MKMKKGEKIGIIILGSLTVLFALCYFIVPLFTRDDYDPNQTKAASNAQVLATTSQAFVPEVPAITHVQTPEAVKGIYMTACVVGSKSLRQGLEDIANKTEINTLIIDIKDFSGKISFKSDDPTLAQYVSDRCRADDMTDFIRELHSKNIYVIGRVTTFQDPFYTKINPEAAIRRKSDGGVWTDKNGISYIDPGSHEAWDHVIAIAKAGHDIGFDEINFDYIRYPSDGNVSDIRLPQSALGSSKPQVLELFWSYLDSKMKEYNIPHSADLFGLTTTNYDDLGIGQVLERAMPYFDFIDPMVYPSHYPATFNGWKNPNAVPYDLIQYVLSTAVTRAEASTTRIKTLVSEPIASTSPELYTKESYTAQKIRPWLQDFSLGQPRYTAQDVRDQIQATYDDGIHSWLLWNAANHYSLDALIKDATSTVY
jgi:hypothetical protein